MKRLIFFLCLAASPLFATSYVVLFKQAEVSISSLEHGAFQNLLQTANQKSVAQLSEWLSGNNFAGSRATIKSLWLVRGAVVEMTPEAATSLKREGWVRGVYPNTLKRYLNPTGPVSISNSIRESEESTLWGLKRINLPQVRSEFPQITGAGVRVGILDTGIQSRHPQFEKLAGVTFKDFVIGLPTAYDDNGHGTHVAGTIAGGQTGIAPSAAIIFGKILDANGSGMLSGILSGMQWVFDPDGDPATNDFPQIVSNSWGGELDEKLTQNIDEVEPFRLAIQTWIHGGIIPVFAAGNSGTSPNGIPGGLPEALAVGALLSTNEIAPFSSSGPNIWKIGENVFSFLKPDISAPGSKITSSYPGNKYATMDGTSMATPHVAGALALAMQANKKLRFADAKDLLLRSSEKKADVAFGYGILDAYKLVRLAISGR